MLHMIKRLGVVLSWALRHPVRAGVRLVYKCRMRWGPPSGDPVVAYQHWVRQDEKRARRERRAIGKAIQAMPSRPLVSVVMPVYAPNLAHLKAAIDSVRAQSYPNWELSIADDASPGSEVGDFLRATAARDDRIKVVFRSANGHISAASNSALEQARGEVVVLLDQDDCLAPHALYLCVKTFLAEPETGLTYSDEDMLDVEGRRTQPFFKPDWSPHLLFQQCYFGHLLAFRRKLLDQVGGFRLGYEGAQDYDLALRLAAVTRVGHIPHILYHWRQHQQSTALNADAKPYAHIAGRRALEDALGARYGDRISGIEDGTYPFTYQPRFKLPADLKVSIIIPTRDRLDLLVPCVESILERSSHANYEVLILDNNSCKSETAAYLSRIHQIDARLKALPAPIPFNWSRLNNIGARATTGEVLVFLNNDTSVITPDWMERLAELALLPETGVVGALLMYPEDTIQHAGVVVGMGGWADHVYKGLPADHYRSWGYVSPCLTRNVLAVTGACLAIERSKFYALGGFDEEFVICGSDVELGIRAHKRGYYNAVCAQARLYHYESKTRDSHVPEVDFVQSALKYAPYRTERCDPFFNPNLDLAQSQPCAARQCLAY